MSEKIVQLNEEIIKGQLKELVRGSVEETLNELLEKEAESLTQAARYERSEGRQGYRSGHYDRNLTTTSGDVTLHVPRLKGVSFETAIIERYRRRESSVEEALIEMYLAGVSVRRVEDITEALWGSKVSPATISELNKKAYVHIEDWRNRPLQGGRYPYVYVDGIYLRRNWGGEYENVAILVAIAVNEDGFREILGAAEGMKEDKTSWVSFFQWLRGRGLNGVKLIVGDKCLGMLEAVGEVFPDAKYQRCVVHFYRNVFSVVPKSKAKIVAKMLKAIHAQENKKASREKAKAVVAELRAMKLKEAAKKVEDGIEETLTYCDFPSEHWTRIRTNNVIERLNREIRRRTRVVGTFPDGNSALMLVCARLRHVECIILSVNDTYMDAQEVMHMTDYSKITALYSRLSVGDEDRDGGESNSIQNQKIFLENYARGQHLTNIRHYIDDDESGRFFDRSAYSRMMDDVENGKIGVCIMKDLTRWGRDYLQVGNAMEIFRRNNVRFIAVNNGIDSEKPDTLEFAPFINIMSEWYAKDISKKVKTGIKTKGMSGKPIVTEAPYGYVKDPDNKDFWIIDEEAAEVVRLIFRLFIGGKNRNQIAVYLTQEQIPTPTFYMKDRGRGTCKNKTLNEDNRCKWNKATLTNILTRQEYCGDVVNFKTTKHFRDKHNHYVDRSQWHITENVHEPIISRSDFETVQRILENAPVRRPNGDGEIHPLSGLLFCKDCGAKMHIRIDYRNGGKRHVAYCSEYHKGKAKNPKCHSPHIMDADLLMQTIAEVLKKIEDYSISNRAEFEALVKKNLAMQQTDQTKKQQKRIPQITTRLEQIDKVLNKLYEDNALGTIPQDRYEQMSQKYSEEYYALKAELATLQEQLSAYENAGGRAQKFLKLTERHAAFTELTPAILNEFISRIEVHERDQKRARYAIQHISIYFNYIGKFENEVTQLAEPTEQEIRQMREEIEEAKKEKSRAYHRQYSREYRARNLEKQREYDRIKAREYRARRKAQAAAAQPTQ